MTGGHDDPVVQRRRLRVELRAARQDAGKTQGDVAKAMEWSTSKVIRIESGDVKITRNDLKALLDYYEITDEQRVAELLEMARTAREEPWSDYRNVHSPAFLEYLSYEASAWIHRQYADDIVPGLLQTEEYSHALQLGAFKVSDAVAERRWEVRERRQRLHERDKPPQMRFILDEAVVRRDVGGRRVLLGQVRRLRQWATESHVDLQVIPFSAGAHVGVGAGPFILLDFRDPRDDDLLYLEHDIERTIRESPEEIGRYQERFFELKETALSPEDTLAFLDEIISDLGDPASPEGATTTT